MIMAETGIELSRNIRRMPVESAWDAAILAQVCGLLWKLRAGVGRGNATPVHFGGAATPIAGQVHPATPPGQLVPFAPASPSAGAAPAAPSTPMRMEPEEPEAQQGVKRRTAAKTKAKSKARSAPPLAIADGVQAQGPSSSSAAAAATPRPRSTEDKAESSSSSSDSDDSISVGQADDDPEQPRVVKREATEEEARGAPPALRPRSSEALASSAGTAAMV